MTMSDDEDEFLAQFLESEVLCEEDSDREEAAAAAEAEGEEERRRRKRPRVEEGAASGGGGDGKSVRSSSSSAPSSTNNEIIASGGGGCVRGYSASGDVSGRTNPRVTMVVDTGSFSKIPHELFHHILKFLSSEDLVACALVCRFLNYVASDEALWRRLYCMRWGLLPPTKKLRDCAWKKLYIERDEEDMVEFVRYCPSEFKEYYIQMQAAKRSQAPLPSQVNDDRIILDKTVADQVSIWKSSRGLTDKVVTDHACSGEICSYYQIGDVFVCEKTGQVHVCDDTCREVVLDPRNELLVCTISGHCFDRLLSPAEIDPDFEQQQVGEEAEPFMGSGRFARAYMLGYNCADEEELEAALRIC